MCLEYTVTALSITVSDLCMWYLQNVNAMQMVANEQKQRRTQIQTGNMRH